MFGGIYNKFDLEQVEFEDQTKNVLKHFQECIALFSCDKIITIILFIKHGASISHVLFQIQAEASLS